jgi:hypothetical protein
VHAAVDVWFDLVERLVAEQRSLTTTLVDAGAALGEQARTAATAAGSATTATETGSATTATEAGSATTSATNGHAV